MARKDATLRRLDKEIDLCMSERCRLRGQLEAREISSQDYINGIESIGKRHQLACAQRSTRMIELGMSPPAPTTDSLIY